MNPRFALLAALVVPSIASALDGQVGLTVGVTTAKESRLLGNVFLGLDGAMGLLPAPSYRFGTEVRWQVGPQVQARINLLGRPSFALGAMASGQRIACRLPAIGARTEVAFALEEQHTGLRIGVAGTGFYHQARIDGTFGPGVPQVAFAAGNSIHNTDFGGCAVAGRPVRDEAGNSVLPCNEGTDADWLKTAHDEHAAIASFVVLAQQLAALGAPRSLIGAVLHAAAEEAGHAIEAYRRAGTLVIRPMPLPHRPIVDRTTTLRRIAHEALHDGVINEGRALLGVLAQRDDAREEALARHLDQVAREEATHIEVNAQVHRWCLQELGQAA